MLKSYLTTFISSLILICVSQYKPCSCNTESPLNILINVCWYTNSYEFISYLYVYLYSFKNHGNLFQNELLNLESQL